MSATFYFIKDKKAKPPYFNLIEKLDYCTWVKTVEQYDIVWDINTKHGKFYLSKNPDLFYKKQAYFGYTELKKEIELNSDDQVIKTGSYSFFMTFDKERGISIVQFYKNVQKQLLPLLFELSKKLDCYLIKNTKTVIDQEYIDGVEMKIDPSKTK